MTVKTSTVAARAISLREDVTPTALITVPWNRDRLCETGCKARTRIPLNPETWGAVKYYQAGEFVPRAGQLGARQLTNHGLAFALQNTRVLLLRKQREVNV